MYLQRYTECCNTLAPKILLRQVENTFGDAVVMKIKLLEG